MSGRVPPPNAAAVAALGGFAMMSIELAAVRVLAPHFGDSAFVWTNVIGVMLVALAIGAWIGGRLADQGHGAPRLGALFIAAGLWTTVVPLVAPALGSWLLPQELPLDAALPALVRGSLLASLLLFAPAVALVGCMTPLLVAILAAEGRVGTACGLVAAASTLGSLVGVFATTHWLVPEFGSRITLWVDAAALLLCAALLRPLRARAAAAALPLLLVPWDHGPLRPATRGAELLEEVETPLQYLQVVATAVMDQRTVELKINEGLDSFHSVAVAGTPYTAGRYYDYHAVVPFLVGDGVRPAPLRVLSLGAGAGTFERVFAAAHPGCTVDAVELDAAAVALGEQFFGRRRAPGRTYAGLDARVFAARARGPYEVVLVDCYAHQIYIPAHVSSRQFFAAVCGLLCPAGAVAVNCGGRSFTDPVVRALAGTMAAVFGEAVGFRVPRSRNVMLVARREARVDPGVLAAVVVGDDVELERIRREAASPAAWHVFPPGGEVLDDDRPALDRLQEQALAATATGSPCLTPMDGAVEPAEAERNATARRQAMDLEGALTSLRAARGATARLRLLAGDIRWLLRDLRGAEAEYEAARAGADADLSAPLAERLQGVREELATLERAASIAARNGWLAAAAAVGAAVLAWFALSRGHRRRG